MKLIYGILNTGFTVLFLIGCSNGFKSSGSAPSSAAAANFVFPSDSNGTASGNIVQSGGGGDASGSVTQPNSGITWTGSIAVVLDCSDKASLNTVNYQNAVAAGDSIQLDVNGQVCTSDVPTITGLLEGKNIQLSTLAALCPAAMPSSGKVSLSLLINGKAQSNYLAGNSNSTLYVVWAQNPEDTNVPSSVAQYCGVKASPLVVRIPQDASHPLPLDLSPAHAILFDLLGASDQHKKVKIDWFTNLDYRMLALPNAKGEVLGIDQLFGNNTTGPDGKMADNGYAALAKYDGMSADGLVRLSPAKGRIDQSDAVYPLLRVWLDANFDGFAQPDELVPLAAVGISSINLDASNSYAEMDRYGNMSLLKSVVNLVNGSTDLIFDLWFAY